MNRFALAVAAIACVGVAIAFAWRPTDLSSAQTLVETASEPPATAPVQPESSPQTPEVTKPVQPAKRVISRAAYDITPLSREEVTKLASSLDPEAFRVTQKAGTEPPFCGNLLDNKKDGLYACVVCGLPLFASDSKFTSGTGWPSFFMPFDREHVTGKDDTSHGMKRIEINCHRCDAHLGHVFDDGPKPTGLRFCVNSASLVFHEKGTELPPESRPIPTETAYFAGGCFWGIEHYLQKGPGVINVVSGYMQGHTENPTYKQICEEDTGHAETVKVVYDPTKISYDRLLEAFFVMHDPTQLNRQGPDYGPQYRSGVWFVNDEQRQAAEKRIDMMRRAGVKVVTQLEAAKVFWPAELYHQDYIENTGRPCNVRNPW